MSVVAFIFLRRATAIVCAAAMLAACSEPDGSPHAEPEGAGSHPRFDDVTVEAGLAEFRHQNGAAGKKWFPESMGAGGAFLDYDGDRLPDILLVGGGTWGGKGAGEVPALRLFRNENGTSYRDVTDAAGLGEVRAYGFGIAVADYDNDGDDDFYFTTLHRNLLFRNDAGRFMEVSEEAGLSGADEWSTCAVFFDANRDGHLDLYVCNYVDWTPETDLFCTFDGTTKEYCTPHEYRGISGRFYLSQGDGTFEERTNEAGMSDAPGKALGAVELDYNRDGWPDLVVANDTHRDLLFENDGNGTFTETGISRGIAFDESGRPRAGMGIDAGVVDTTGETSIFIGNFSREMIGVYRYAGNGMFVDRAALSKIGHSSFLTLTFGLFLFDYDLDSDLDLFAANGHVQPLVASTQEGVGYAQQPQLFANDGTGVFDVVPGQAALADKYVARGAAYADIDGDGDLDVLLTENDGPVHLWINRTDLTGANYLRVRLEGSTTNHAGIGSVVNVHAGGRKMERRIRTNFSYLSSSEPTATFGLGDLQTADKVIVDWASGGVDTLHTVPANQELLIQEGRDATHVSR